MQISCAVTAQLISAFVFTTRIVQSLFYLYSILYAYSFLKLLYRRVSVGAGWKSRRPFFSHCGSLENVSRGNNLWSRLFIFSFIFSSPVRKCRKSYCSHVGVNVSIAQILKFLVKVYITITTHLGDPEVKVVDKNFVLKFLVKVFINLYVYISWTCLYPRHLCRRVYSFRFSIRPFVCSFVSSFLRS